MARWRGRRSVVDWTDGVWTASDVEGTTGFPPKDVLSMLSPTGSEVSFLAFIDARMAEMADEFSTVLEDKIEYYTPLECSD